MLQQRAWMATWVAVALATAACGGDDTKKDSGLPEAGMDAAIAAMDSGLDAGMDTGTPTGMPDTGVPMIDAGMDASMDATVDAGDAATDAATDAGMDATVDAGDAGDTGTDSAVDPCAAVANPCTTEGLSCSGTLLVTCAQDNDGCLVETSEDCDSGSTNYCSPNEDTAECAFDPCLALSNPCSTEGVSCDGSELVECAMDADGCLAETRTECIDATHNVCDDSDSPAVCAFDPCKDEDGVDKQDVCVIDDTTCADDVLVDCVPDADGCPIATPTDCTMDGGNNFCNGDLIPPACDYDPCLVVADPCFPEGIECEGTEIVTCARDTDGCLVETREQCADMGASFTCSVEDPDDAGVPSPVCALCNDDPECTGKSEGDFACDGNDLVECTDTTGDGCLNAVRENCGNNFTCCNAADDPTGCPAVAEPRCAYTANAMCDSAITAVLDAPGSYGAPYDTSDVSAGNEFSAYPCPDPSLPFNAASPDLLFAIDIPSGTAMSVAFDTPMGFGSTGVWMLLLSECADGNNTEAEDSCVAVSNMSVTQANETNSTQRYYLVVDADDIFPATDNVGTFGLTVDVRPLTCGDGHQDGSEECDDANTLPDDGCAPDCTLEENFVCTQSTIATPSVCTRRASVCGNVQCDALPASAPSTAQSCCTPTQECGVAVPEWYGASCLPRDQMGPVDTGQCGTESGGLIGFFFGFPTLQGCCRPDGDCGLMTNDDAGCVERTALWQAMLDGPASAIYDGPFGQNSCTP